MAAAGPPPDGKDNLAPVEDLLNENPSHVALRKIIAFSIQGIYEYDCNLYF